MLRIRNHNSLNKPIRLKKYADCSIARYWCLLCGQKKGLMNKKRICWKCVRDKLESANFKFL